MKLRFLLISVVCWAVALASIVQVGLSPSRENERSATVDPSIITWDDSSLIIRGERIYFLSAEFHPFRLPSPGLWLDVFQKVKAIGFSGVSFYVLWPLLEGEPGQFRAEGVFALEQFFESAKQAGIYLLARPGPYINSEVTGGGFPGWLQRIKGNLRSTDADFLNSTKLYIQSIGEIISKAEITKGGPVVLFQPENEYSLCTGGTDFSNFSLCLDKEYMASVENAYREAGITVPFLSNDAVPIGNFKPGSWAGEVDIYGFDLYPLGWGGATCANPSNWTMGGFTPAQYLPAIRNISLPTSPRSITEFQGGYPDPWGGVGVDNCNALVNHEFERVLYKMNYGFHTTIFNLYMTYGGTNWGNIGHPLGYTSYDVGAAIREDRAVVREKYAELKLQGNFLKASTTFLTAKPLGDSVGVYTDTSDISISLLTGEKSKFYIARHGDHTSFTNTSYSLRVQTVAGNITVPQLGGSLSLHGRDAKIHVVDYDVGGVNLIYSSAEVFTWKRFGPKVVLILYGGENETHEFALPSTLGNGTSTSPEANFKQQQVNGSQVFQWTVSKERTIINFGDELDVYLLWRNEAYQYWVLDLPAPEPMGLYTSPSRLNSTSEISSVIVKGGYLLRTAVASGEKLKLTGDLNATTDLEVISALDAGYTFWSFNGINLATKEVGRNLIANVPYVHPNISLPDFSTLDWRFVDSLPEVAPGYDDQDWKACNHKTSNSPRNLTTPTSLYGGDYGFHTGSLLFCGHFTANGKETTLYLQTKGGMAYGHSVWLNSTFLGSFPGSKNYEAFNHTLPLPTSIKDGSQYVITVLMDHMGYDENFYVDSNQMKNPRGILNYNLSGHSNQSDIAWKITGNFGGEQYYDHSRGALNEGSMFAERQGFHLPGTNTSDWTKKSPVKDGIASGGVGFFATNFDLNIPSGYDVPLHVVLKGAPATNSTGNFRVQIYVNGWQFGKYVNNIGPQTSFPVPEGIIYHQGENYLALTLWALDGQGARLESIGLQYDIAVQSGYTKPLPVEGAKYQRRMGSY